MGVPPTGPMWVGEVERTDVRELQVEPRFRAARVLALRDGVPAGLVTVPLRDGRASADAVRAALDAELGPVPQLGPAEPPTSAEPVTVVIATRNRHTSVRRCVASVLRGDHPAVTVLVVDNDPSDDATQKVVEEFDDPAVRYVREHRRGASTGRNRGLWEARTSVVAFTDDDTEVDTRWASRIAGAFAVEPELACLSGPVFGARLDTPEEIAAETGLVWNKGFRSQRYSLGTPPAGSAIFPFSPGLYGIGANFAVRAEPARAVGGLDEALGPGTPTLGAEDGEFMVRLVLAGHAVGYEPGVYLWHHHRSSPDELRNQLRGYAMGLGAFLTKIAMDPRAGAMALKRMPAAVAQLRHIEQRETDATMQSGDGPSTVERLSWMASGGAAYVRSRRAVRKAGGRVSALTHGEPGKGAR